MQTSTPAAVAVKPARQLYQRAALNTSVLATPVAKSLNQPGQGPALPVSASIIIVAQLQQKDTLIHTENT